MYFYHLYPHSLTSVRPNENDPLPNLHQCFYLRRFPHYLLSGINVTQPDCQDTCKMQFSWANWKECHTTEFSLQRGFLVFFLRWPTPVPLYQAHCSFRLSQRALTLCHDMCWLVYCKFHNKRDLSFLVQCIQPHEHEYHKVQSFRMFFFIHAFLLPRRVSGTL